MGTSWQEHIEIFWNTAGTKSPESLRNELEQLLAQRPADDSEVLFERASLHDYLGEEALAVGPYREAIAGTLSGEKLCEARIQLASTLRNLGEFQEAIELLRMVGQDSATYRDAQAFLALALHDAGEFAQALQVALQALAPSLELYARPVHDYAGELTAK
ncbi:tetratricopeptide repeat protein [Glutamicibacter arilaitensis]|uniref:tetratricopeptide repeat protein n=1 Tax=Glutamicibacter arilaitensis TaxID=256701 RepID=UPI00384EE974